MSGFDDEDTPPEGSRKSRLTDSQRAMRPWRRLLSGEASPADYDQLRQEDPVRVMIEVIRAIAKERQDDQSGRHEERQRDLQDLERVVHDAIDKRTEGLAEQVVELRRDIDPVRGFAKWALGGAVTALVAVGVFLYSRGVSEGAEHEKLNRAIDDIKEVRSWLGHHENRSNTP